MPNLKQEIEQFSNQKLVDAYQAHQEALGLLYRILDRLNRYESNLKHDAAFNKDFIDALNKIVSRINDYSKEARIQEDRIKKQLGGLSDEELQQKLDLLLGK